MTNIYPRPALLRLEDVGPGGPYRTLDDLGKLRAVFSYLLEAAVPFHVALIPRWKNIEPDGSWYEKGIDDPRPDDFLRKWIQVMQAAERRGAIIGMHGYTHQYGNQKRQDQNQDTGAGSEFNVAGAPQTKTASYALERFSKSLAAFKKAGLYPAFWESPHYNDTQEQEDIFESLISVLYQPDIKQRAAATYYVTETGSVYIPTPLDYIHATNTVEQILGKLPSLRELASVFYHPYLEFPFLEPVAEHTANTGKIGPIGNTKVIGDIGQHGSKHPVLKDGIPVYQYRTGSESDLQRLVKGFQQHGYRFVSFYEILPFRPPIRL